MRPARAGPPRSRSSRGGSTRLHRSRDHPGPQLRHRSGPARRALDLGVPALALLMCGWLLIHTGWPRNDRDMVETCARILQRGGYACLMATGAREALDLLRRYRLDLILTDLRMPEMDGLTLLAHARRDAPTVPVVIFTAYGSMETARQAREAGAAAYLAKPFGVGELQDTVARILGRAPTREGGSGPAAGPGAMGSS